MNDYNVHRIALACVITQVVITMVLSYLVSIKMCYSVAMELTTCHTMTRYVAVTNDKPYSIYIYYVNPESIQLISLSVNSSSIA